jgi:hypothetical protein
MDTRDSPQCGQIEAEVQGPSRVDPEHERITATQVTPGAVNEGELLAEMIGHHEHNPRSDVKTAVAESPIQEISLLLPKREITGYD